MSNWESGQLSPLAMASPMFSFVENARRVSAGPPPRRMSTLYALPSFGFTSVQEFLAAEEAMTLQLQCALCVASAHGTVASSHGTIRQMPSG